ncbi:hypothetical protein GmHk_08G022674 [Glycine max]|nr:hypothetical protein GmHk_08G022674 [Glycine max]
MARPPPSNRNNDLPNMEGQPTQTSVSNANINSGIGAIPDQTVGTISSTASTVMNQTGVTSPMTNMTLASSTTSASAFSPWNNPSLGNPSGSPFRPPQNPLYGMPTSLMVGLQNSQPNIENLNMASPSGSVAGNQGRVIPQHLTNTSVLSLRQQMDESNHDMVNMLTQQIGTVINPLIQNTNDSYQTLTNQISRIADFFGAPPIQQPPIRQIQIQAPVQEIQMPNNPGMQMAQAPQPAARIEPPVQQVEPNPASVRRKALESIDDYLNRFRLLKARCFTQVPEHELVEMAAGGLDYSIRKKLDTQFLRDMAQLADRVRQLERLKAEKARNSKFHKKEKVAYVETNDSDQEFDIIYEDIEDITDGQIVVPKGLKVPPIEQQKKRGYCKFHNFLGHKTSRCVLFRDLVQKALDEGRLKFGEKPKVVQANAETSKAAETLYAEPQEIMMVETMEVSHVQVQDVSEEDYNEQMKVVYPQAEEELIDFLNRCKLENKIVMLCPRCSAVCDKEATEGLKKYQVVNKGARQNQRFDKGKRVMVQSNTNQKSGRRNTFAPPGSVPVEKWMHQGLIRFNKGIMEVGGSSGTKQIGPQEANRYSYRNNYKGKNPMTRTQWRRFQRQKKLAQQNPQMGQYKEVSRRPVKERLLPPCKHLASTMLRRPRRRRARTHKENHGGNDDDDDGARDSDDGCSGSTREEQKIDENSYKD